MPRASSREATLPGCWKLDDEQAAYSPRPYNSYPVPRLQLPASRSLRKHVPW